MLNNHVSRSLPVTAPGFPLAKLLDAVAQPVFSLAGDRVINYCNVAASTDLGLKVGDIVPVVSRGDGTYADVSASCAAAHPAYRLIPLNPAPGAGGWVGGCFSQADSRAIAEVALRRQRTDTLTGLADRGQFLADAPRALVYGCTKGVEVGVVFIDLDHFKAVNDTLGHDAGDTLLKEVGRRVTDVLGQGDTMYRLGGDEFAIISYPTSKADISALLNSVVTALSVTPVILSGQAVPISCSAGGTLYPEHGTSVEQLLKNADVAMYQAKREGRNSWRVYDVVEGENARRAGVLAQAMRSALSNGELALYYQPQACPRTGTVSGMEALLRWTNPEFGQVPANKAIAAAEDTGAIHDIGIWVLETACRQAMAWLATGKAIASIAVNVSPLQLRRADFTDRVIAVMRELGVPAGLLELEITENALIHDEDGAIQQLTLLREAGARISLDDFGTGYSSLSLLSRLPVSKVKLDRSFLTASDRGKAAEVVLGLSGLVKRLGMRLVLEGVSEPAHWALAIEAEADTVQGYLLSQPVPVNMAETFLSDASPMVQLTSHHYLDN